MSDKATSYLLLSYLHAIETQFHAQSNVHLFDIAELVYFVYSNITSIKQRGSSYLIPNAAKLRSKESIRCKNRNHKRSMSSGAAVGCRAIIRHRDQIEVAFKVAVLHLQNRSITFQEREEVQTQKSHHIKVTMVLSP